MFFSDYTESQSYKKKYVLMFGSGGANNNTFTHDNSEVDIYYLILF